MKHDFPRCLRWITFVEVKLESWNFIDLVSSPRRLFLRRVCFIPIKPLSSQRRCLRPLDSTTGDVITDQEHHSSGLCVQGHCVLGLVSNRFSEPLPDSLGHCSKMKNTKSLMFLCSRPDHDNSTSENVITDREHHSSGAILVPVVASTSSFFRLTREPMDSGHGIVSFTPKLTATGTSLRQEEFDENKLWS